MISIGVRIIIVEGFRTELLPKEVKAGMIFRYRGMDRGKHQFTQEPSDMYAEALELMLDQKTLDHEKFQKYVRVVDDWPDEPAGSPIVIKWHLEDVQDWARRNYEDTPLTDAQCLDILAEMKHRHDCNVGINWEVIDVYVGELVTAITQVWQFAYSSETCTNAEVSRVLRKDPKNDHGDTDEIGWHPGLLVRCAYGKTFDPDWVYFEGTGTECYEKARELGQSNSSHLRRCSQKLLTALSAALVHDNRDASVQVRTCSNIGFVPGPVVRCKRVADGSWEAEQDVGSVFGAEVQGVYSGKGSTKEEAIADLEKNREVMQEAMWAEPDGPIEDWDEKDL